MLLNKIPPWASHCFKSKVSSDIHNIAGAITITSVQEQLPTKPTITAEDNLDGYQMRTYESQQQFKDCCRLHRAIEPTLSNVSNHREPPAKAVRKKVAVVVAISMEPAQSRRVWY